jgi:NAD(P)-dependent dehydrogenase (short-subunit alcohol dehydrogenase family)
MSLNRAVLITGANHWHRFRHPAGTRSLLRSDHSLLGCRDLLKGEASIQELRKVGITSPTEPIPIAVTSDNSIRAAVQTVDSNFGGLDVLVNNAGAAVIPAAPDFSGYRSTFSAVYDTNATSVAITMQLFLLLLHKPPSSVVFNVSSGTGSLGISAWGKMPPTVSIPYSISKATLNAVILGMATFLENQDVQFQVVLPVHRETEFNGYRRTRDPLEGGANVMVELVNAEKGRVPNARFW